MTKHLSLFEKILLIVVSIITIWQFIEPKFSVIESSFKEEKAILPKMIQDTVIGYSAQSISFDVKKYIDRNYKSSNELNSPIDSLNLILNSNVVNKDFEKFKSAMHYHYTINIRNINSKEIEGINVSTKNDGAYVLYQDNKPYRDGFFLGKIDLDNMNPEDNAVLHIWTMPLYEGDIRVNYKGGYNKPEKILDATGATAFIVKYGIISLFKFLIILFIIIHFTPKIIAHFYNKYQSRNTDEQ